MDKRFYQSKKFVYAVAMLIAVIVLVVLPATCESLGFTLEPESVAALNDIVPGVIIVFALVIAGHSLQDALTTAKGAQPVDIRQAVLDVIAAIPLEELIRETSISNISITASAMPTPVEAVPKGEQ